MHDERSLLARLDALQIAHRTVRHPPVRTVEEAKQHRTGGDGHHIKNLFLRDKKGRMWLLSVLEDRPIDLKALRGLLGARGGPSFGSADRLQRVLGVAPGSVTPFAAINDAEGAVEVYLDAALREGGTVHAHPLHNEATTAIDAADLVRFLHDAGHPPRWLYLDPLIRPAQRDDLDAIAPLLREADRTPAWFLAAVDAATARPDEEAVLLADDDAGIAGVARVSLTASGPSPAYRLSPTWVRPTGDPRRIEAALKSARLDWIDARGGTVHDSAT